VAFREMARQERFGGEALVLAIRLANDSALLYKQNEMIEKRDWR
jgi:hypothetical protein